MSASRSDSGNSVQVSGREVVGESINTAPEQFKYCSLLLAKSLPSGLCAATPMSVQ